MKVQQIPTIQTGQLMTAPGVYTTTTDGFEIGTLLSSIMPLIMLMMVFMMITPMMKGMGEAFK